VRDVGVREKRARNVQGAGGRRQREEGRGNKQSRVSISCEIRVGGMSIMKETLPNLLWRRPIGIGQSK